MLLSASEALRMQIYIHMRHLCALRWHRMRWTQVFGTRFNGNPVVAWLRSSPKSCIQLTKYQVGCRRCCISIRNTRSTAKQLQPKAKQVERKERKTNIRCLWWQSPVPPHVVVVARTTNRNKTIRREPRKVCVRSRAFAGWTEGDQWTRISLAPTHNHLHSQACGP